MDTKNKINPLWIITSPRSGSTYLCNLLNRLIIKKPDEYSNFAEHYNPCLYEKSFYTRLIFREVGNILEDDEFKEKSVPEKVRTIFKKLDYNDSRYKRIYTRRIINKKAYPKYNKLFPHIIPDKKFFPKLISHYPDIKFIHLVRKNIFEQTASYCLSINSGLFSFYHLDEKTIGEYLSSHFNISTKEIEDKYQFIKNDANQAAEYAKYFQELDCPVHTVYYEDLCENLHKTLMGIFDFISYDEYDKNTLRREINKIRRTNISKVVTHPQKKDYVDKIKRIVS